MRRARVGAAFAALVAVVLALAPLGGCRKPTDEELAAAAEKLRLEMDDATAKISAAQAAGDLAGALKLADQAARNRRFKGCNGGFRQLRSDLLFRLGRAADARREVLAMWRDGLSEARSAADGLLNQYLSVKDDCGLVEWCKELAAAKQVPSGYRDDLWLNVAKAGARLKDSGPVKDTLDYFAARADGQAKPADQAAGDSKQPDQSVRASSALLQRVESSLAPLFTTADGESLLAAVGEWRAGAKPGVFADFALRMQLAGECARGSWDKAAELFGAAVGQLPDDGLLRSTRETFSSARKAGQTNLVERLALSLVQGASAKKRAAAYAARQWVDAGVRANPAVLPERLNQLDAAKLDPDQQGSLFEGYFYSAVNNPATVRELCAIGLRLMSKCANTNTVNGIRVKVLDGAFITGNYPVAIEMLEKGIPGRDATWHKMSLPKVRAHYALERKQPREAVKHFREFMKVWQEQDKEEEFDPSTNVAYSKEWILGRNAARIAKILDTIPDPGEAAKARDEAKAYFTKALEKAKDDPQALKLLKEETKELGM